MRRGRGWWRKLVLAVVGLTLLAGMGGAALAAEARMLNGAGATFPYPIYSKWMEVFGNETGIRVNYQSIGSGGGIKQITEKTVDFGASDGPMNDEQLKKAPGEILHIPTVMGAVVPTYNLPGVSAELKFTGDVLADIFLGKIKKWNDPRLTALNPGVNLPNKDIIVAHRSDGSGTTYIWVDYLSKVSGEWKEKVGRGTAVKWPTGLGGKGNEGVTALVKQNPYSLGYVELIYAEQNKLLHGSVKNRAGKFVKASLATVTEAAAAARRSGEIPEDLRMSITDAPDGYPISGFTWLLVYKNQDDEARGKALVRYLWWAIHDGQKLAPSLKYAALPAEIREMAEDKVRLVSYKGKSLLAVPATGGSRVRLRVGSTAAEVGGGGKALEAAPFIRNNRTMVPVRLITEGLGGQVNWDAATRKVTIRLGGSTIVLTIDKSTATKNSRSVTLDAPAEIRNGRTFVPVRFVSEALGFKVDWNAADQAVTITR